MENNNTPRKARIQYKGESIPVLVEAEYDRNYELLLDWDTLVEESNTDTKRVRIRNLYLDALFGWEGAHEAHKYVSAVGTPLALYKTYVGATLVFDEQEPKEAQGEPVDDTGIDDVLPHSDTHDELNQHLTLLARTGYKVKSFDLSIQEGGAAHLCATFAKELDN